MPNVYDIERVSGDGGKRTVNKYHFNGGRRIIKETVSYNELPKEKMSIYTTGNIKNLVKNTFYEENGKTLWKMHVEFSGGFFLYIITKLFPNKFKQQTLRNMNAFKTWAENQ